MMVSFMVFYNVYSGVRAVDLDLVNLTLVMGANQRQLTYHVYFPPAAPYVMLGMRMAVPYSVIGVFAGEITCSNPGLGLFIHEASSALHPPRLSARRVNPLALVLGAPLTAGAVGRRVVI